MSAEHARTVNFSIMKWGHKVGSRYNTIRLKCEICMNRLQFFAVTSTFSAIVALSRQTNLKLQHIRRSTYPAQGAEVRQIPPLPLPVKSKVEPLPPPLFGCTCSECNAQQSLGALTLNRTLCQHQTANQITK